MTPPPLPPDETFTRRRFLKLGTAATVTSSLGVSMMPTNAKPAARRRPNIVFVFSDEHRWCSLPFTEMPEAVTPNLTKLASQGTRFDNCCATSPVCTPFRGILLTGQWPHQSECISNDTFINGDAIGRTSPTIAHVFNEAGYTTGYVGKWHLQNETCQHAGFDYFKHWLYGDDHWKTEVRDIPSGEAFQTVRGYNATGMTDQALEFIGEQTGTDDPFLLMLSLNPPHFRWDDSPEEFYDLYPDENLPYRPNVVEEQKRGKKSHDSYRHYHGHISAVDRELGRIMRALDEAGISEDTIVVYTSDHGSSFGSNGLYNKGNPFDEAVRVPFIVRWPGRIPAGRAADHNLGGIDLFPTLCGLAGFAAPPTCGGQDFSPVFLDQPGPDPETQFTLINNYNRNYFHSRLVPGERGALSPFRSVRGKRYSYAVDSLGEWFLYDNQADPFQLNNLVNDPDYAGVKAGLAAELDRWIAKAEDPYIPDEWKQLSLPERIAAQNEYYTLLNFPDALPDYRKAALAPHLAGATDEQANHLAAAAEEIFDRDFIGLYLALNNELTGKRRGTDLPVEELEVRMTELKREGNDRLKSAVQRIFSS